MERKSIAGQQNRWKLVDWTPNNFGSTIEDAIEDDSRKGVIEDVINNDSRRDEIGDSINDDSRRGAM